jgi:predicted MPP superfamily phosphohydrolase
MSIGPDRDFELRELLFPMARGPALSILHLTDLHLRAGWTTACERLLALLPELQLQAVCITGDWIEDKFDHRPALPAVRRLAEGLVRLMPGRVVSCLGNHDGDLLASHLVDYGVSVLCNELLTLPHASGAAHFIGLAGVAREDTEVSDLDRLAMQLDLRDADAPRIVLTHYPDAVREVETLRPDLVLAGHTHGGQVCIPRRGWRERGGRAILTHDSLDKSKAQGLCRVDGRWLHIGRGFGCSAFKVRVFCPAEITCVRFFRPVVYSPG